MKTSVEHKVALGFAALVLALLGMGWLSYQTTVDSMAAQDWVAHTYKVIATLEQGRVILTDAETAQRGYLLTGDENFLKDSQDAQSKVNGWLGDMRQFVADNPEQEQRLKLLQPVISKRLEILNNRIKLRQEKGLQVAVEAVTTREGSALSQQIKQQITEMHAAEDQLLSQRTQTAQAAAHAAEILIALGIVLVFVVGVIGVFLIHRDLKLRARAEGKLRQNEERMRLMIGSIRDYAIIMLDPEGNVMAWNEGAQRIKGYATDEIIGQHFSKFYPQESVLEKLPEKILSEAAASGQSENEGWRVRKDGTRFWADVVVAAVRDGAGKLLGFVKVTRDLTERKYAEEHIQKLNTDLQHRADLLESTNKELEAFSYSVSHDLRAPLRHIDGFVKLLDKQANGHLDERGRRYLEIITDSAHRMGALIDDLLIFSRMSRAEMHRTKVDSRALVDEVITSLQDEIRDRHIVWKIGTLSQIKADAAMLRQVWVNLISNAVKYSRPRDPAEIEIGCNTENGGAVFYIQDNGVGFDMQYAHKLFGVFQRLHRAEEFEGTGIGLANVQRIVVRHGGRVWAESKTDEGATFYFSLPETETATVINE